MGYSEVLCHICGVSFNIGRIRQPDEPRSAAWSRYGGETHVDGGRNSHIGECHRDSGCMFTFRKARDDGLKYVVDEKGKRWLGPPAQVQAVQASWEDIEYAGKETKVEVDEDGEYRCEGTDDHEPLEYESDEDMLDDGSHDGGESEMEQPGVEDGDPGYRRFWYDFLMNDKEARKTQEISYEDTLEGYREGFKAWHFPHLPDFGTEDNRNARLDNMFPLFHPTDRDDNASEDGSDSSYTPRPDTSPKTQARDKDGHRRIGKLGYYAGDENTVEHIAGPGCLNRDGYNGHNITVEEMKGCLTSQCLLRRPLINSTAMRPYEPLADDEDFERESDFFLTGLSDHMPSRDYSSPRVFPQRHGCYQPLAENVLWEHGNTGVFAMPFHPPCLEIYRRASRLRSGVDGIAGLTDWWVMEGNHDDFHQFEREVRDPNVKRCAEQDWKHENGTEYLAAHPLLVPALPGILEQAVSNDPSFDPRNDAFHIPEERTTAKGPTDLFATLPHELRILILSHLPSQDIANLRLASHNFRHLPILLWRDLLLRELPWLWEVCGNTTSTPYSKWSTTTAKDLSTWDRKRQNARQAVEDYVRVVSEEMPELADLMHTAVAGSQESADLQAHYAHTSSLAQPYQLPHDKTNWYSLYTLLTRHMLRGELKGLQNRRRIWKDCEEILRRIAEYRDSGAFPVEDATAVVRANNVKMQLRRRAEDERRAEERARKNEVRGRGDGVVHHVAVAEV